jgi:hypothetical protein
MEYDYRLVYICNRINNIYAYSWTHDEFWDCGEYIAAAKLQVGHPPGAPLFQMIGAFFYVCFR